jgi:PAS domain S-box-containing protein
MAMNDAVTTADGRGHLSQRAGRLLVALAVGGSLALAVSLAAMVRGWSQARLANEFENLAEQQAGRLQRSLETNIEVLHSIGSFFAGSIEVERHEFRDFVAHALQRHPEILALEWIPRVPDAERAAVEAAARADGWEDFSIRDLDADQRLVTAPRRDEYYPIYFVQPVEPNRSVLGLDQRPLPLRWAAMQRARDTGLVAATSRVRLTRFSNDRDEIHGLWFFLAIYQRLKPAETVEQRLEHLQGFAALGFEIGRWMELTRPQAVTAGVRLRLYDGTEPAADRLLFSEDWPAAPGLEWRQAIEAADRVWLVVCRPSAEFLAGRWRWEPWAVLAAGLAFTGLLGGWLTSLLRHGRELERRVAERTAQLEDANTELRRQIAERERLQAATRQYAAEIEDLYERAPCGYHSLDANGVFIRINDTALDWLGYAREELVGKKRFPDLLTADSVKTFEQNFPRFKERGEVSDLQFEMIRKDGTILPVLLSATAIRDADGNFLMSRSTFFDMTDLKRAQEALRAVNRELEAFSYSVSHDLRAPLRAIDGFSLALQEDCAAALQEAGRQHLRRVRAATQRMGQLIDDLLNLSRLTRAEMRRERVDLTALAREVAAELRAAAPQRQAEFVIQPGLQADGDSGLLRAALQNLLGNAWKFTGGKAQARIEFGCCQKGGEDAFFVRDNGTGFDMAYADKLFGAFQRLHATAEFEGTGIGLATVQRIIHRHGGRVWAEAEPDRGAAFYFTLEAGAATEPGAQGA